MQKLPSASKKIGQHTYVVTKLDGKLGAKELLRLTKLAAPFLSAMAAENLEKGINGIAEKLTSEEFEHFCDLFAERTVVRGGAYDPDAEVALDLVFAEHFVDNYFELLEWLTFCIRTNFESFFAGAFAKVAKAKDPKAAKGNTNSTSLKAAIGGSGD